MADPNDWLPHPEHEEDQNAHGRLLLKTYAAQNQLRRAQEELDAIERAAADAHARAARSAGLTVRQARLLDRCKHGGDMLSSLDFSKTPCRDVGWDLEHALLPMGYVQLRKGIITITPEGTKELLWIEDNHPEALQDE